MLSSVGIGCRPRLGCYLRTVRVGLFFGNLLTATDVKQFVLLPQAKKDSKAEEREYLPPRKIPWHDLFKSADILLF